MSDSWQLVEAMRSLGFYNMEFTNNMAEDWSCVRILDTGDTYWFTYAGKTLPAERNPLLQ